MKYFITTACAVLFGASAFAQLNARLGVKGGLNLMHSTTRYELNPSGTITESGFGPGFYLGGLMEVSGKSKSSKLKGQLELQYNYLTNSANNVTDRFHVLNIPVSLKYFFKPHMSIIAGVNNNINLAGSNKFKDADSSTEFNNLRTYQPGAHIGFNYYVKNGMFIDLRYSYNFASTLRIDPLDSYYRYGNIQLGVGYKFK